MKKDHYSTLGVAPASEDVAIRAAYRALMRRHHPDADPGAEAADKAREINEAYRVLGDPERRARYNAELTVSSPLTFEPQAYSVNEERKKSRFGPMVAMVVAAAAFGLIVFASLPSMREFVAPSEANRPVVVTKAMPIALPGKSPPKVEAVDRCRDPAATRGIKRELFRQVTARRPANRGQFGDVANRADFRIETRQSDTTRCSGWIALDLPRGLVVDGGRTNLNADIAFTLVTGSGGVRLADLSGTAPLVAALATLGPEPAEPAPQQAQDVPRTATKSPRSAIVAKAQSRPSHRVVVPSSCSAAASRSQRLICADENLSALDQQLVLLYRQSWKEADEKRKATLIATRQSFNDRRDACGSFGCMTTAYVSRLREISDIMAGKVQQ